MTISKDIPVYEIVFKSEHKVAEKEHSGIKNNTLRLVDLTDKRFEIINEWVNHKDFFISIGILDKKTNVTKFNLLKDATFYKGKKYVILSWRI